MLINKPGAEFLYNGITYRVGDVIIGSDQSEYAGPIGSIFEIRDGSDKETDITSGYSKGGRGVFRPV